MEDQSRGEGADYGGNPRGRGMKMESERETKAQVGD